jgi:ATP:cob(I)alamin adenosyltransferase
LCIILITTFENMSKMKWYTGLGDSGKTKVPSKGEVWKDDEMIEALGNIDELNSVLGLVVSFYPEVKSLIQGLQRDLFELSSEIAGFDSGFGEDKVRKLEHEIEFYGDQLTPLRNFVIPGGHVAASLLHLARAVSRRTERSIVSLVKGGLAKSVHLAYLNRFSTLMFVLALWVNQRTGNGNPIWQGKQ